MTKLYEILKSLNEENERLIECEFRSPLDIHVGVRMHPRVFHEIMSDEESKHHIIADYQNRLNWVDGYPIEITYSVDNYEVVDLERKREMTYGELQKLILERFPELRDVIYDYRPAGYYALRLWLKNGTSQIYTYDRDADSFTVEIVSENKE